MAGCVSKGLLALVVLLSLAACGDKPAVETARPRVYVPEVRPTDFAASVTLTGDVQARVQTELWQILSTHLR